MNTTTTEATAYPAPALRDLADAVKDFFKSPDNQAEFEVWRKDRHDRQQIRREGSTEAAETQTHNFIE